MDLTSLFGLVKNGLDAKQVYDECSKIFADTKVKIDVHRGEKKIEIVIFVFTQNPIRKEQVKEVKDKIAEIQAKSPLSVFDFFEIVLQTPQERLLLTCD